MRQYIGFRHFITLLAFGGAVTGVSAYAQLAQPVESPPKSISGLSDAKLRAIANGAVQAFDTPGLALGIVQGGQVRFVDGFGQRDIEHNKSVDADTLFRIASTTKAFTSAALAILVDEGILHWDDKVIDFLPGFRMSDAWVTREFTIRDLLTHRSGLGRGAGDLMLWPEPSGFTRDEIIFNLRYLKPVTSFRSRYAYDNLLYIVAGEVVAKASKSTWEEFVQTRILDPLHMKCFSGKIRKSKLENVAIPYGFIEEKIQSIPRNKIDGSVTASAPAGGLVCNVRGMNTWMLTMLGGGAGPNGQRIFSKAVRDEMWKSQTILSVSASERKLDNTHFKTYALGWRKEDMHGYEVISHTGTLSGMQAYLALVPELDLGVIILNNGSNYGARNSVMQSVLKAYMGQEKQDWVDYYATRQKDAAERRKLVASNDNASDGGSWKGSGKVLRPLTDYSGLYQDAWFGKVDIKNGANGLRFRSHKSKNMVGRLEPFDQNTFIVRWDNRGFGADAYARFETNFKGVISGITMRHVDPNADFSFDFQDLNFERLSE
ncbi:MAG: hypothetical protein COA43_03715 [Robiginitomaculum sp.]|nr:MAG: hypothetical protein COA43_03715 [Robiginitomaculum sp.]